jgi:hypothetical protein
MRVDLDAVHQRKSGATDARAAMPTASPGRALRASAMAGSAITASPSQLGATITRRPTMV